MTRNQIRITLLSGFALVAALIASRPVAAQDADSPKTRDFFVSRNASWGVRRSHSVRLRVATIRV